MTLKLAIWDMDGTIVDSRDVITTAMARAFEMCGLAPPSYDETRHIVGLGLDEACRRLAPADYTDDQLGGLVHAYREAFIVRRQEPDFKEPLYAGAVDTLDRLVEENWLIAMATGKSRRGIDALFEMHDLATYFDSIHCADDGPGKPHPAMCLAAMDKMGAAAEESVMIGDAIHDIRMGRAAGIHTIGVTWGFGERDELEAVDAHDIVDDFAGLNARLDQFAASRGEAS